MKRQFEVKPLTLDRIDVTYPIAQASAPGLTLEKWRQFAETAIAPADATTAPGLLVVEGKGGYIQGFCAYRVQPDPDRGTVLAIDQLVALDLIDGDALAAALIDSLEARARQLGCGAIRLQPAEGPHERSGGPVLQELMRRSGLAHRTVRLVGPIDMPLD